MPIRKSEGIKLPSLSAADFERLSGFVHAQTGIKVTDAKKSLFESRLQKRLRHLEMDDFGEYCRFLFSGAGIETELHHLIDEVTTHKTDFFREPGHFDFLNDVALPELLKDSGKEGLVIWSAACSTGEEPYTIAMILSENQERFFLARGNSQNFSVLATDISAGAVQHAKNAIYREEQIAPIPGHLRKKYLLRSKNRARRLVRMAPEIRSMVRFSPFNLIDGDFGQIGRSDIIFCRNVIIYFDRDTQKKLLQRIYHKLAPGGYLFMGHSEAIHGFGLPLAKVGPSVYRKTA